MPLTTLFLRTLTPDIVDTYEDRKPVWLEVETVLLPTLHQLSSAISRIAPIKNVHLQVRTQRRDQSSDHRDVAIAEVKHDVAAATHVGDTIALKNNTLPVLEWQVGHD
jgi:hypothetical protein